MGHTIPVQDFVCLLDGFCLLEDMLLVWRRYGGANVQRKCATVRHPRIVGDGSGNGVDLDYPILAQVVAIDVEGLQPICNSDTGCIWEIP